MYTIYIYRTIRTCTHVTFSFLTQCVFLIRHIFRVFSVGLRDRIPKTEFDFPTAFLGWIFNRTSMILLPWLVLGFLIYWCWCVLYLYTLREVHFLTHRCTHTYDIRTLLKYTYISLSLSLFQWRKTISSFQWFRNQGPLGTFRDLSKSQVMRSTPIWAQRIHATNLPLLATQPCQPSPFQRSTRLDFCCQWVWVSPNY